MILLDAHNYIKRIYHGGGNPYALVYNLLIKYDAEPVVFVCDTATSRAYRKAIFAGYKDRGDSGDDPVYWEVYNNITKMANLQANVKVVRVTTGEADDFIILNAERGDEVVSNDKDLWPLVDRGVNISLNASTTVTVPFVWTKFKALPKHIHLYKALVGDPSDKIPGKKGFGPVAWDKLSEVQRDALAEAFKNGVIIDEALMTEQALMSWKLAAPLSEIETTTDHKSETTQTMLEFLDSIGVVI